MSVGKSSDEPRVLGASALKAYAHPLRVQIIRYLNDHGAATATELSKHLGESTGQTSYHLRQLAKHGLIEDDADRGKGRERWWKSVSLQFDAATLSKDPALVPAAQMVMDAMVQQRAETLNAWVSRRPPKQWERGAQHSQLTLRLTPEETEELSDQVAAVTERYRELSRAREAAPEQRPAGTERVRVYYDAFPLLEADDDA